MTVELLPLCAVVVTTVALIQPSLWLPLPIRIHLCSFELSSL